MTLDNSKLAEYITDFGDPKIRKTLVFRTPIQHDENHRQIYRRAILSTENSEYRLLRIIDYYLMGVERGIIDVPSDFVLNDLERDFESIKNSLKFEKNGSLTRVEFQNYFKFIDQRIQAVKKQLLST